MLAAECWFVRTRKVLYFKVRTQVSHLRVFSDVIFVIKIANSVLIIT